MTIKEEILKAIEESFNEIEAKAFSQKGIKDIIKSNRKLWNFPDDKPIKKIVDFLAENSKLKIIKIDNQHIVFSWNTMDELTIINALKPGAYFTHYSAVYIHQLSTQIPKVYYLNTEHAKSSIGYGELTQEGIDKAFSKPQRKTETIYVYNDKKINLLNGKFTGKLGVNKESSSDKYYFYTDLERTLIDISVRPSYSGGVFEVIDIFNKAKEIADPEKLLAYLEKMQFIYPYHQVIGFYLDVTGYSFEAINLFHKDLNYDFYLTYEIRMKEYSEKWRLYYPKGISLSND